MRLSSWLWRVAFIGALAGTAWFSLRRPADLPSAFLISDVLSHGVGYAALGALAVLSGLRPVWAVAVAGSYGFLLEVAQGLVGYRTFEWKDVVVNIVGALIGVAITNWSSRLRLPASSTTRPRFDKE